jgi:sugar phosphate isomerase/epimerase
MAKIPVALQLYSIRADCARDLPGSLKAVADMGYEGVEFAGYYDRSAAELRSMLDDLGLKVAGTHTALRTVLDEELPRTIEFNRQLGNTYLIVPSLPAERRASRQAWRETAELFNAISEKVEAAGMRLGYHNHAVEFQPLDGELPWDTFFGNTRDEVIMQFDVGNAMHGGADDVPFLERYPGRATTVHLKDHSATNDKALLGEGDARWDDIFRLCESSSGTRWYIVEQESYAYPPLECVERCLDNVRRMGR